MTAVVRHVPKGHERESAPRWPHETAPEASLEGQIRLNLLDCAKRAAERCPEALVLEARIVAAIRRSVRGEGAALRGPRSAEAWADVLEGKRRMNAGDLARLAKSGRSKGQAGALAAATLLAAEVGYRVTPKAGAWQSDHLVGAALIEHAGQAIGMLLRFLEDGKLDAEERAKLLPVALEHQRLSTDLVAIAQGGAA